MTQALSAAIDDAIIQRELLLHGMHRAQVDSNDEEALRLEHLLDALDGVLAVATCGETRH
jgi:hypothetical protein